MKNHYKICDGEITVNGKKKCKNCKKLSSKVSFARLRLSCQANEEELSET